MALICRIFSKRIARSFAMYLGQNSVQSTASQIHDYSIFLAIFLFSLLNISEYLFSTSKKIVKFLQSLFSKFQPPNKSFRPGFKPSRQFEITALD